MTNFLRGAASGIIGFAAGAAFTVTMNAWGQTHSVKTTIKATSTAPAAVTGITITANLPIQIYNGLQIIFTPASPTVACNAAPGTLVSTVTTAGGNGNAVTLSPLSGDTGDFVLTGNTIVVGPNGILPANCPVPPAVTATQTVGETASQ